MGPLLDLAIALAVALIAGGIAFRLRQPVIMGYLVAGIVVGPHALGLIGDEAQVRSLAEIGVAFLMFALGVEFSFARLAQVRSVAIIGGIAQIVLTVLAGAVVGLAIGLDSTQSIFFGSLISLSSTTVVVKILSDRAELDTLHGKIMTGILIVQDLSVVPMMVILPALAAPETGALLLGLATAMAKAALVLAAILILGTYLFPRLLFRVAATHSRELFILTVISLVLATAIGAAALGLSVAFGAFIAGLVISESYFSHEILDELRPLRDVFATLFFVSIGMLARPQFIVENLSIIAVVVAAILIIKSIVCTAVTKAFPYSGRIAILVGLGLVQIGEFSFVVAQQAFSQGVLSEYVYELILAGALITIVLTPAVMNLDPGLVALLERFPTLSSHFLYRGQEEGERVQPELTQHVVICGYGRVGQVLARVLRNRKFKYFVIEYDPYIIEELRHEGIPCAYGDASHRKVLAQSNLPKAKLLAATVPDPNTAKLITRNALEINPRLDVIVRAHQTQEMALLRAAGATEIVQPEFEASLEIVRHTLHRFGVSGLEIQSLLSHLREEYYHPDEQ
ncbi:MAG: cation:proton antiporter [Chloroflexi bacterium]|nr:cation:proton antiporter [Chloroflexota bacterium]